VTLLLTLVAIAGGLLGLAGAAYFALSTWAGLRFRRELKPGATSGYAPPVSILKSLKGIDPHMYGAFVSHCALDYPEYEVIFGVHDTGEPALALVEKLQQEFPRQSLRVVLCPESLGLNGKVSNLAQMLPQARYEHIIINDSDIVVPPDYLRRVMRPFEDPGVGMVTTLYRGLAGRTLGSRLEALGLSTDFAGGVLLARAMEGGIRFGLGATIAITKDVLEKIGGLAALANHLGDDYELGERTAALGRKIVLADTVLETTLPDYSFRDFWLHQMRWARNVKDSRPGQYAGLIATFGLAWAIIAVLARPFSCWTWAILAVTAIARFTAAVVMGRGVLNDQQTVASLWLVPLRDFVALAVWMVSYFGDTVVWRGTRFRLNKGKLEPSGR
jgi:ceramide glucosyltransferase